MVKKITMFAGIYKYIVINSLYKLCQDFFFFFSTSKTLYLSSEIVSKNMVIIIFGQ